MRKKSKGDTWDGIYFADPEVGRVLHANGLIADAEKSSIEELATITSLSSYFEYNEVITKFPELKYCTGLSSLGYTFRGCSNLTEVGNIPEGVTNMGDTFSYCKSLINAPSIPNGVTNMNFTFNSCSSLVNTPVIPEGITSLRSTFRGCSNLTEVGNIPEGVTDMYSTFAYCSSLTEAPIIPSSVDAIFDTFYFCTSLDGIFVIKPVTPPTYASTFSGVNVVAIYVPDESVDTYKSAEGWSDHSSKIYPISQYWDGIFADPEVGRVLHANGLIADAEKSSIEELATITSLNPGGGNTTGYFYNNKVITKFPELQYCTGLSDLKFTFRECSSLTEVGMIPDSVTNMFETFYGCSSLTDAPIIPNSVTNMTYVFRNCSNLTEVGIIPNSVVNMTGTFQNCTSLVSAPIIPSSVVDMQATFRSCRGLDGIFMIKPVTPPTYSLTFFLAANVVAIYVPDESVDTYKNASGWSDHSSKIKPMSELPE